MKKNFLLCMLLSLMSLSAFAIDRVALFREGFKPDPNWMATNQDGFGLNWGLLGNTAAGFVGDVSQWQLTLQLGYTITTRADSPVSAGYDNFGFGASGNSHTIAPTSGFAVSEISTERYRDVYLSFAMKASTISGLKIEYQTLGDWVELEFTADDIEIKAATAPWYYVTIKKTFPSVKSMSFRMTTSGTFPSIDDLCVSGEPDSGFDLRVHIEESEAILNGAKEGLELGMFLSGKAALETSLAAAKVVNAKPRYTYEEALAADTDLKAKLDAFRNNKITTSNAPKIAQVANQPISFSNESKTINLSGISATGSGATITSLDIVSLKGNCAITDKAYTNGNATGSFKYTGASPKFGKDTIVVTVTQSANSAVITNKIEMRFAVEVLDANNNIPPAIDKIANQYNVFGDNQPHTIALTGISPVNPGQTITSIVATSDKTDIIANPTINTGTVNTDGKATLSYTPSSGKTGAVKITVEITDNAAGTTTGTAKTTVDFMVYVFDSANQPAMFDVPEQKEIVAGIGDSKIIIPNVRNLNKIGSSQFKVEVLSGGELIETPTITYNKDQHFALLNIKDKSLAGTVTLRVMLGDYMQEFDLKISPFSNPGISFQVYDIIFWQRTNPISVGAAPIYDEVIDKSLCPTQSDKTFWGENYEKWEEFIAKITTDCEPPGGSGYCNPYPIGDMGTMALKGFFIPKLSGNYKFTFYAFQDFTGGIFLDQTATSWRAAQSVAYFAKNTDTGAVTKVGTADESAWTVTSDDIYLEAGKVYPIYAVRFYIHNTAFDMRVEGPGMAQQVITGDLIAPLYDVVRPDAPTGFKIHTVFAKEMRLEWNAVSSGSKIAKVVGYNVYVNGKKDNSAPVTTLNYMLRDLDPSTAYSVFVTSIDELGNESQISNTETATTLADSATKPGKPTNVRDESKTGEVIKLRWAKPTATGSDVVAYDVAVNGTGSEHIQNVGYIFNTDSFFIRKLQPETEYKIYVRAYNGSMVVSDWSDEVKITTTAFDPLKEQDPGFNEYRVRLDVEKRNIAWFDGIGINPNVFSDTLHQEPKNKYRNQIDALKPSVIRFGGFEPNESGLYSVSGNQADAGRRAATIGSARKKAGNATHGMNLDYCNKIGAYYSFCIGTKQGPGGTHSGNYTVDYMDPVKGPQVFKNLIEYLAGPSTSVYGILRSGEGFTEPLLDPTNPMCKGVIIEMGNEVWGGNSHCAPIGENYTAYGEWCREMIAAMRSSEHYEKVKDLIYFAYSGRDPGVSQVNQNVVRGSKPGEVQVFAVSGYLGGNLNYNPDVNYGETVSHYYRLRTQHAATNLQGLQSCIKDQMAMTGSYLSPYFYESQVSSSSYFGNLGQAVLLLDYHTASLKYGSILPAMFSFDGGEWRITIDGRPYAHYDIARLINTYCKGHLLSTSVVTNNQLLCEDVNGKMMPIKGHEPVGTTVYNNGKQWSVLLFSRDFDQEYSVQLNLPEDIGEIKNAKRFIVTGDGSENGPSIREGFYVTPGSGESVSLKNGQVVHVPPFSMVMYTFEANDPEFERLPLGHLDRILPQDIELTGNFFIDKDKGSTKINVAVTPDDAFSKGIIWDISEAVNGHMEGCKFPSLSVSLDAVTVRAQGSASQGYVPNAPFWLKATLADNPSISKSVRINITNQTAPDCGRISVDETEVKTVVYPNPAENVLFVKTESDNQKTLTVYNESGQRVLSEVASGELIELDVTSLVGGKYFITINENGSLETVPFVKK